MQPDTEHQTGKTPGYEQRDVDVRAVLRPALGLFVVTVLTFVAMGWTRDFFEWRREWLDRRAGVIKLEPEPPPAPRLQTSPPAELADVRSAQGRILGSYGWIDRTRGVVRIPVKRAMDLVAEEGLPLRTEGAR